MKNKYLILIITYSIVIAIGVGSMIILRSVYLDDSQTVKIQPEDFKGESHDLTYMVYSKGQPVNNIFNTVVLKDDLSKIDSEKICFVIHKLNTQAYKVFLNNTYLGSVGDYRSGRSNIWNTIHIFEFDKNILKEKNTIIIKTNNLYMSGTDSPLIFCNDKKGELLQDLNNIFLIGYYFLSVGFSLFAVIVSFLLYKYSENKNKNYIFFALSIIFNLIFGLDYLSIELLPFKYIIFKKITVLSAYLSVYFVSVVISNFFNEKKLKILSFITLIGIIIILIISNDVITLKSFYNIWNITLIINAITWIFICIRNLKSSQKAKIFLFALVIISIYSVFMVTITLINKEFIFIFTPYYYTIILSICIVFLLFEEVNRKEIKIKRESEKLNKFYIDSITDNITGLYNYNYYNNIVSKKITNYKSFVIIDIDDFKYVNDNYGHLFGNKVLKKGSQVLKDELGFTNNIIRYGGDEFLILFEYGRDTEIVTLMEKTKEKFKNALKSLDENLSVSFSAGISDINSEDNKESVMHKADLALYKAKNIGKDCVVIYNNSLEEDNSINN